MRTTPLAVAMHEAGHAVIQLANPPAPYIDSISITGLGEGLLGLVNTSAQWQPYMAEVPGAGDVTEAWRQLAWRDTIFHLAGPIAEMRWRRHSRAAIWLEAETFAWQCFGGDVPEPFSDLGRVHARLSWAYPDDCLERFCDAWIEAEEQVGRHWRSILSVGRLLHRRGRLTGAELMAEWQRLQG